VDRCTPPGRFDAEVAVGESVRAAVLQVQEDIDLQLSEPEFVVVGEPDVDQARHAVLRNDGNVSLPVRVIGPAKLHPDRPSQSLLERMGLVRTAAFGERSVKDTECSEGEREGGDEDEHTPTVVARVREPLTVSPGESVLSEWTITVHGPLRHGVRYRATAPLYLSDVTFVVTPSQEPPRDQPTKPRRSRGTAQPRPRPASSTPQERRD
jgi:hypothetical protein